MVTTKQVNEHLAHENNIFRSTNRNLSAEVARLIEVDQELVEAKGKLEQVVNELAAKEIQVIIIYNSYNTPVRFVSDL